MPQPSGPVTASRLPPAALLVAAGVALAALGPACAERPGSEGTGHVSALLSGTGLRDEVRSLRVVAFDLADQGCVGPRVPQPDLSPLATSGLVRTDVFQVTLAIPAGPRTLYVETYRDADGLDPFGTGCAEVVLAAGERRTVRIEIVAAAPGDADADADVPDGADADVPVDADGAPDGPPDAEDFGPEFDAEPDGPDVTDEGLEADVAEEDVGGEALDVDVPETLDGDVAAEDAPDGTDAPDVADVVEDEASETTDAPGETGDADAGPALPTLVISEIDYDSVGTDLTEFVELYNYGAAAVPCAGLELQFANGVTGTGVVYGTQPLTCTAIPAGTFHVVGSDALRLTLPVGCSSERLRGGVQDLVQNGGSGSTGEGDALALFWDDGSGAVVVDGVVYEGPVLGWGEGSPAPGDNNTRLGSLQRRPPAADSHDNGTDFFVLDPTACAAPP